MSAGSAASPSDQSPRRGLNAIITDWIEDWGAAAMDSVAAIGALAMFTWNTVYWLFTRRPKKETLLPRFDRPTVLAV